MPPLQLGTERFKAPEILFHPEIVGLEYRGIHELVADSISRVDLDLRRSLYSNIVLSGGTTLTKGRYVVLVMHIRTSMALLPCSAFISGFGDRLLSEVRKLALRDVKIKIYAPPERKYSTWIGGSILASLSTFSMELGDLSTLYHLILGLPRQRKCGSRPRSTKRTRRSYSERCFSWDVHV